MAFFLKKTMRDNLDSNPAASSASSGAGQTIMTDDVRKLAALVKFDLSDAELEHLKTEIEQLLQYFERLDTLDLEGVEPTLSVHGRTSVMRADEVQEQLVAPADLLALAPQRKDNYIQVKRMI